MKKLFLLSALGAIGAFSASAQLAIGTSMLRNDFMPKAKFEASKTADGTITSTADPIPNGKTTVGGSRWYSYTDYCALLDAAFVNNGSSPYLWNKGNGMGIYSTTGGGLIADTIQLSSYAMSFDPAFGQTGTKPTLSGFNEPTVYPKGSIVVRRTNAYVIDSVIAYGFYGRNNTRTAPVDTLRFSIVYGGAAAGSDMPVFYFTGMTSSFGSDTVRFAAIKYDKVNNIAKGATLVKKDIYLTTAKLTDTIPGGGHAFKIPVGLNVPAGNVVGIAVTFITGDTYTPYVDTIFYGSARSSNPFGRGMVRPSFFEQTAGGFPKYYPNFYNVGFIKNLPESASWDSLYVPSYAYTAPLTLEIPNIDVKVSCATCNTIQELSITDAAILDKVGAYPNPSNTELNVPFTLLEKANVTVSLTNMVGQVIATENMGSLNAGQKATATFNTGNLAAGIYLYTVEANGQRVTNRFTVAH